MLLFLCFEFRNDPQRQEEQTKVKGLVRRLLSEFFSAPRGCCFAFEAPRYLDSGERLRFRGFLFLAFFLLFFLLRGFQLRGGRNTKQRAVLSRKANVGRLSGFGCYSFGGCSSSPPVDVNSPREGR